MNPFYLVDIIIVFISFYLAYFLRSILSPATIQPFSFYYSFIVFTILVFLTLFFVYRLYNKRRTFSLLYTVDFLKAFSLWGFFIIAFPFFTKTDYSRAIVVLYFFTALILVFFLRYILLTFSLEKKKGAVSDPEVLHTLNELLKISSFSPDNLSVVEHIRRAHHTSDVYYFAKRFLDIVVALVGLLTTLPFYPLIMFLIWREDGGPMFLSQKRVGQDGKFFMMYKFRTMKKDTDLYGPLLTTAGDSRTTKIGKVLRRYSIDELPQFWNVLKGNMSIVGPRPELHFVVKGYEEWEKIRLSVKPGLTCLWQIFGRKDSTPEEKIEYDVYYVYHQSFFLDFAIILRTIPVLVFARGAY